jgi:hypothetical protein
MQWAILSSDPSLSDMNKDERACFRVYSSFGRPKNKPVIIGKVDGSKGQDTFSVWNPKPYSYPTGYGRGERKQYENFCAGWMAFYDEVVRSNAINHIILFDWNKKTNKLNIWISPPAINRSEKKYQDFIKYLPVIDPPTTPPPPPPPRDL